MTIKPEKADDDIDALEALASEEKEFVKVRLLFPSPPALLTHDTITGCRNRSNSESFSSRCVSPPSMRLG